MIAKFDLETLSQLDEGRIREAFEQAIRRCEADCKDRPALDDARKVELHVHLSPVVGDDGNLETCNVQFQIKDSVPKRKSRVYNMKSTNGGLVFNELSPEDVRQQTLDEAAGPQGAVENAG